MMIEFLVYCLVLLKMKTHDPTATVLFLFVGVFDRAQHIVISVLDLTNDHDAKVLHRFVILYTPRHYQGRWMRI